MSIKQKFLAISTLLLVLAVFSPIALAQGPTVQVTDHPTMGKMLIADNGMTLYLFLNDTENTSNCYDACAQNWPPLLAANGETPVAGDGVTGTLGTTARTDGTLQVTYNGMPLYFFAADAQPGDGNGQNVKDVWYVVHPSIADMTTASPKINTAENAELGTILTSQGFTLYRFANDTENTSNCYGDCAGLWPPLLTSDGNFSAADGIGGTFGTISRTDGGTQITYNGMPLYFWKNDVRPGDTNGQGVKDVWFVVNPTDSIMAPTALPVTGGEPISPLSSTTLAVLIGGAAFLSGLALRLTRRLR